MFRDRDMKTYRKNIRTVLALVVAGALSVSLAGCDRHDSSDSQRSDSQSQETVTQKDDSSSQSQKNSPKYSEIKPFATSADGLKAVKAAEGVKNGLAIGVDREDLDAYWEVTVLEGNDEVEYRVSADNTVTEHKRETADKDDIAWRQKAISLTDAVEKTGIDLSQAVLDQVELDEENNRIVYQIDYDDADGHDYKKIEIDAYSGEVVSSRDDH